VFITDTANVSSSSNDIVFLAANTTSKRISSDVDDYYTVTAVEKNEVKTLQVRWDANVSMAGAGVITNVTYNPATDDNETHCVILNNVTYDSNDLITLGQFSSTKLKVDVKQGVRRVNSEEVRVGTHSNNSLLRDVAENIRVYFVDGDDVYEITVDEIVNDTMDMAYYVEEDGELTYLFIVDYEDEAVITEASVLYGDGEIEQVNNTNFVYHYVTNNAPATVIDALKGWLNANGLLSDLSKDATLATIDNGYTITIAGVPYTVTYAKDAKAVVTMTAAPTLSANVSWAVESSKQYHAYSVVAGTPATLGDVNAASDKFVAASTATFTVRPVSTSVTSVSLTVNDGTNATTYAGVPVAGSATDDFTVTFPVPNANFTISVSAS
jgi:hypothetical protein